jgi:hypothetical protein
VGNNVEDRRVLLVIDEAEYRFEHIPSVADGLGAAVLEFPSAEVAEQVKDLFYREVPHCPFGFKLIRRDSLEPFQVVFARREMSLAFEIWTNLNTDYHPVNPIYARIAETRMRLESLWQELDAATSVHQPETTMFPEESTRAPDSQHGGDPDLEPNGGNHVTLVAAVVVDKVHISRPREFFCVKAEGQSAHSIPPGRTAMFQLFAEKVASGVGSEVVFHRDLIRAVEGIEPTGPVTRASDAVRAAISDLNAELRQWATPTDRRAWIRPLSRQGYRLNSSVTWEIDGQDLKADLARKSRSVYSLNTHDADAVADNTPNRDQRLPARSRKSKARTSDESPELAGDDG